MARPPNADGQRTRQAILDAALALFADKGYFGTSLRDVAGAVGVRESALYNYFPGKDALFEAILTAHQDSRMERLAPLADGPITDGRALLVRLANSTLDAYVEPREEKLFRILMSDGIRLARSGRLNLYERLGHSRDRVHDILRRFDSEIVASRQWDERRLSYPVGPHKKGTYLLTYFKVDGAKIKEIVAACHLHELVVRELLLKVHPKLVDHLVAQAMSFTHYDEGPPPEDDGGRRPRRDRDRDRDRD